MGSKIAFEQIPARTRDSLKILLLAFFCVSAFLFHIWFRTKVLTSGYELGRLRQDNSKLESQIVSLRVEKNRLMGPDELERWVKIYASQGLELGAPQKKQVIYLPRVEAPETVGAKKIVKEGLR